MAMLVTRSLANVDDSIATFSVSGDDLFDCRQTAHVVERRNKRAHQPGQSKNRAGADQQPHHGQIEVVGGPLLESVLGRADQPRRDVLIDEDQHGCQ